MNKFSSQKFKFYGSKLIFFPLSDHILYIGMILCSRKLIIIN